MFGIRENRKIDCALTIRGNFVGKVFTYICWVDTDRQQLYILILFQKHSESGQLPGAVRSPITTIEDEYHRTLSARLRQRDLPPVLIVEGEVWGRLADRYCGHALRHHLNPSPRDSR